MSADAHRPEPSDPADRVLAPLPPPDVLARYERECPGSAKRLMNLHLAEARRVLAEERAEAVHRRAAERAAQRAVAAEAAGQRAVEVRGQLLGFLVAHSVLGLCAYGFYLGYPQIAASLACAVVVSLVTAFVRTRPPAPPPPSG